MEKIVKSKGTISRENIRFFLQYLRPYWKATLLAPLLMVLEVLCDLAQPRLLVQMVDTGIMKGDGNFIFRTGTLMVGIALLGMAGGVGCTVAASYASQGFGKDVRSALFRKIQSFSFSNLDSFPPSTLITRMTNDVTQLQNLVLMSLRIVVRAPLLFLGGIIMVLILKPQIASTLLLAVAVQILIFLYLLKRGFPLFVVVQKMVDRMNMVIRENLVGVRVVRSFARSLWEKSRFHSVNQKLMETTVHAFLPIITFMPLAMLCMNLSMVAVLWFGGFFLKMGYIQIGEIMAILNYVTQILFSLMMIGHIFVFVSRAGASVLRVQEVLEAPIDIVNPRRADPSPITRGEVIFERVSFYYDGERSEPVLRDISFTAYPKGVVAIVGTTGSGKSTLVRCIPRLYDPTEGRILIDGKNVRERDLQVLRSAIGVVFQEPVLFSGTIRENIAWGNPSSTLEEVIEVARIAQVHDFIMSLPEGHETFVGQRGVNLSGGQKQRLAIARALLKKPAILILDDSTSAVDPVTERLILEGLRKWWERCTVFIITQRLCTVEDVDKILVLDKGRLVAQGRHDELLRTCSLYEEMYRLQKKGMVETHVS